MNIAITGSLNYPVGPATQGGIETFCYLLVEKLMKRGHNVDLYGVGGSITHANLIELAPQGVRESDLSSSQRIEQEIRLTIELFNQLKASQTRYDIIHNNVINYLGFIEASRLDHCLTTFHLPTLADHFIHARASLPEVVQANYVAISDFQRQATDVNFIDRVYNGIDLRQFDLVIEPEEYLTWLGRIEPRKGLREAIMLATDLSIPLKFAGSPWDEAYYDEIKSMTSQSIIDRGLVKSTERNQLLGRAKALLFPLQWDEPFGLVLIEAMACGTPVIAYDRGAISEVIEHGVTGFVVPPNDTQAMKVAIQTVMTMPNQAYQAMRQACRARVEQFFTIEKMVDGYENVYNKLRR